ncbi:MAG: PKD domain-containing protein [Ferruginibacter sp.]
MKKFLLFFILTDILGFVSFSQNFSNKGRDFWVGYGYHQVMIANNAQDMVLYFAADQVTTVTVSIPGSGFSQTFSNIPANTIFTTPVIPKAGFTDARLLVEGISGKGIHIESTKPIVAYAHIYNSSVSGACVLLPTATLGKEYYSINYTNNSNTGNANCWFYVVAVDTGTTNIEIVPTANTVGGWIAGNTYTVSLTQGQIYNVMGSLLSSPANCNPVCTAVDLTGSKIKSIASGTGGCKRIGVFSGSGRISLTCNGNQSSSDNYMVQAFPKAAWGKKFLTTSTGGNMTRNIYRICVSDPTTVVKVNGAVTSLPLINNFYYEIPFTLNPQKIEGDLPITVAQYVPSQNACSNGSPGDPEVIYLSPVEQSISDVLFNSNLLVAANPSHFVNVIVPNGGTAISSFKRDGVTVPAALFTVHPQDAAYSYIKIAGLTLGQHTLLSDSGFNAIAYGFATAESYGYNAGTNVRDFNQQLFTPSQYGIINDGNSYACLNTPFKFSIYLPDSSVSNSGATAGSSLLVRYDSMKWNVTSATSFIPNNFPFTIIGSLPHLPTYPNLVVPADSVNIRNGKPVAWYSIPSNYAITTPGTYTITVTGYLTNNNDGCASGNETEFVFTLVVPSAPIANFTNSVPGCPTEPVQFIETNPQTPYANATYLFMWNFGDPASGAANTSTERNPVHTYSAPGTYSVTFSNITTAGCISASTSQDVIVPALVNATLTGTTVVCQNAPQPNLNFTITGGLPPYKINYTVSTNGGAAVAQAPIITSTLSNPFPVPTTTAGIYTYNITSVANANPSFCTNPITGQTATVTVNPLPTAIISGTTNVCQNTAAQTVTFTGTGGSTASTIYQFTYTLSINGIAGTVQTINSNTAGIATISVATITIGTYSYDLISVSDVATSCLKTLTAGATTNATVFVQATPTGTVTANNTVVCQDGIAPTVIFTGSGANGQGPYTFTYSIKTNGVIGPVQSISTLGTLASTNPIPIPMATAGTIIYALSSVQNSGAINCINNYPAATAPTTTITINPVASATITGTTAVCQAAGVQTVTFTGAGGLGQYSIVYSINGVTQTTALTTVGNTATVTVPVTPTGTFLYEIVSVTDVSTNCIKNYTAPRPSVTVTIQATSTATISGTTTVCQDATAPFVTFTASNGVAPFTFSYAVTTNGVTGAIQTISSNPLSSNSVSFQIPMTTIGTLVYTLLHVQNTGSINCTTAITGQTATFTINPIPSATITGTTTVCQNTGTQPVTFTGAGATGGAAASYVFNYTLNGIAQMPLTGNNIIVNQPTTAASVYTYVITSVRDNATGCIKTYTTGAPTSVVTVQQLATATIATNAATVCKASTTLPVITFTALGGVAPYRFNYTITINGVTGAVQSTPFTPFGNSYSVSLPTATPGTFIYTLVSVQESSSVNCVNAQTSSTQIIVYPKPTASFTTTGPFCEFKSVLITPSFAIMPTGSITSWVWDYGDGTGPQTRPNGNPFSLTYSTGGVKIITFKTVSDNGCVSDVFTPTPPVTIFSKPKAGFVNPAACLADAQAQFLDTSTVAGLGASIVFWEWDFGDGSPVFAGSGPTYQNPTHAYAAVGQKAATLIVTSNSGCKDTTIQQFFINGEVTRAAFTTLNAANLCSNRPVQIRENSLVNVGGLIRTDIYWDYLGAPTVFDQDNTPTPNKIYTHNYPNLQTDQTYRVRYYAYSGFNGVCQKDTIINIVVRASPVAVFTTVPDVCLNGGPVTLSQGIPAGGIGVYSGPGVTFAGGVYTFNPLAPGVVIGVTDSVLYTVTSLAGCDSVRVQQIKVLAPPVVNTFFTVGNLCQNNAITFRNTHINGDGTVIKWIYNWNDGSPLQIMTTGADVTHVYTTTGSHTATLTLETGYGCRNVPFQTQQFIVNPLPAPTYNPSSSVCLPSANVVFTNTTANIGSNNYQWSFDLPSTAPANTSTAPSPTHTYTSQGPFNTQLIATNIATGCIGTSVIQVINSNIIHPAPVVQFTNIPDVCLKNGIVSFAALASETSGIAGGPGVFSGLGIVSANGDFNPLTAGVGQHTITYTWTSSFNCPTTITKTVNVLAAPVADFATVGNTCQNSAITFHQTSSASVGTITEWIYDWGDGTAPQTFTNSNDQTHIYTTAPATPFTATLMVITSDGCKSLLKQIPVTVNPQPLPDFRFSDTACLPQAKVLFTNITPNINDWAFNWNFDFPSILVADLSTQPQPLSHTYFTQSPHNVKLAATSAFTGCTNTITKAITTIHPAPTASFNFNKASVCLAQNVTVLDNSTFADGSPLKWSWNFGESSSNQIGQSQPAYTYSTANTFNVKLTVTNSFGCVDDTIRKFTVYPYPVVNAGTDNFVLEGGSIPLAATATGNNLSYLWTAVPLPTYLSSNIVLNPVSTPVVDVKYILTVTAEGNCQKADSVFIKVLKIPEIPNTFTPNNDGIHDLWEIKYLFTYPGNKVEVFTRTGQLVFESKGYAKPWNGTMNGKPLPFDTYYYIIEPGSGRNPLTGYVTIVK